MEHLLRRAARDPRAPRAALYKEVLNSETYLLTIDDPIPQSEARRVTRADASFPVWADKDPLLGGVWVPLFPARDRVREFVLARGLKPPRGKEFLWMGHMPGQVFGLLRGIPRFAGLRFYLDAGTWVDFSWAEVCELSQGRVPVEAPVLYELPFDRLVIPAGARLSFGRLRPWLGEEAPLLLTMPGAGRFQPEDIRRLVRLPLGDGRHAWTPCRHFIQILHHLRQSGAERSLESIVASLLAFELYGEAEAFCEWLAARGRQAYAWMVLSAVYGRVGRLEECAELCARAIRRYPKERAFHVNGLRALAALGRRDEAVRLGEAALRLFPEEESVRTILHELVPQVSRG